MLRQPVGRLAQAADLRPSVVRELLDVRGDLRPTLSAADVLGDGRSPRRARAGLDSRSFRSTLRAVEIHRSARKHGVDDEGIHHAIDHALLIEDAGEDPNRSLVIGPDRAGNLLELVVLTTRDMHLAIHAMALRAKYRRLLEQ